VITVVAEATEADMDKAVGAVRRDFDDGPWPRLSPDERAV
jgi:acyl-CoA reductase-like NAD-dependent aldehyde dehydrogenase